MADELVLTDRGRLWAGECGHPTCTGPTSDDPLGQLCDVSGGTIWTVDGWPREAEMADEFLATAAAPVVRVDGATVTIAVSNGLAVYELGEPDVQRRCRPAYLVTSRFSEHGYA